MKHIAGILNVIYDGLSRGKRGVDLGLAADKEVVLSDTSPAVQYITLCNPNVKMEVAEDHTDLSINFLRILNDLRGAERDDTIISL